MIDKTTSKFIKIIAIFMMILHHMYAFPERIASEITVSHFILKVALGFRLCVPIFILISGYGFGIKIHNSSITKRYIFKRVISFYYLFWFTMIITLPVGKLLNKSMFLDEKITVGNILGFASDYNKEWWFVGLYISLVLALPLFSYLYKEGKKKFCGVSIILYVVGVLYKKLGFNKIINCVILNNSIENFLVYQIVLCTGILLADKKVSSKIELYFTNRIIAFCMIVFSCCIRIFLPRQIYRLDFLLAAGVVIGIAYFIDEMKIKKIVNFFPDNTVTFMWLTHTFFCYYYLKDVVYYFQNIVVQVIIEVLLTYIVSRGFNKIYNKIYKVIGVN